MTHPHGGSVQTCRYWNIQQKQALGQEAGAASHAPSFSDEIPERRLRAVRSSLSSGKHGVERASGYDGFAWQSDHRSLQVPASAAEEGAHDRPQRTRHLARDRVREIGEHVVTDAFNTPLVFRHAPLPKLAAGDADGSELAPENVFVARAAVRDDIGNRKQHHRRKVLRRVDGAREDAAEQGVGDEKRLARAPSSPLASRKQETPRLERPNPLCELLPSREMIPRHPNAFGVRVPDSDNHVKPALVRGELGENSLQARSVRGFANLGRRSEGYGRDHAGEPSRVAEIETVLAELTRIEVEDKEGLRTGSGAAALRTQAGGRHG